MYKGGVIDEINAGIVLVCSPLERNVEPRQRVRVSWSAGDPPIANIGIRSSACGGRLFFCQVHERRSK